MTSGHEEEYTPERIRALPWVSGYSGDKRRNRLMSALTALQRQDPSSDRAELITEVEAAIERDGEKGSGN